jgi:hypothetical protein
MREIRTSGSEGGAAQVNAPSLPLSGMGNLKFAKQVSPATAGSGMLFENLIKH